MERPGGYDDKLVLGSLAGSGTLGILIAPSIIMIVYGVAADVPITHLLIALSQQPVRAQRRSARPKLQPFVFAPKAARIA